MSDKKFNYTYTALSEEEKEQIRYIKQKYQPQEEDDKRMQVQKIKKLHKKIVNVTNAVPLTVGIVGCLIFGIGLTFMLEWDNIVCGIIFGCIGIIIMFFAYPIYKCVKKLMNKKYAGEIIELSNDLLSDEE